MSAITLAELRPGLSAFLDDQILRNCPDCRSNVRTRSNLANRAGPFLIAGAEPNDAWLCVPLVSHTGNGRVPLDQKLKSGPGNGWRHRPSYFSIHQFWIIPSQCFLDASAGEFSPVGDRQRYADATPAALTEIARHRFDSDAPYLLLSALK